MLRPMDRAGLVHRGRTWSAATAAFLALIYLSGCASLQQEAATPEPVAPVAKPSVSPAYELNDVHFHLTNYVQQGNGNGEFDINIDVTGLIAGLGLGGLVKQLAINCTMKQRDGCNIVLQIESGHSNLLNPKAKQRLQQALGEYFNIEAQLEIEVAAHVEAESPAQTIKREVDERQQQAERAVEEDSFTQSLKESFNAELVPGSVKPVS